MVEEILRALVFVLIFPLITAVVSYFRGLRSIAVVSNGVFLFLILCGFLQAILITPSMRTVEGIPYFVVPVILLAVCVLAFFFKKLQAALFWSVWVFNLASFGFLFYLSFLFRIRF